MMRTLSTLVLASLLGLSGCGLLEPETEGEAETGAREPELREPPPGMLAAPSYGEVAFLVSGSGADTRVDRFDGRTWTTLPWPDDGLRPGEQLVDGETKLGPDGRVYLLSNQRVFTIEGGDAPALSVHAELPPREPADAVPDAFAPGPGGELWVAVPIPGDQSLFHYAGGSWSEIPRARIGGSEGFAAALVGADGRPWLASLTRVVHGTRMGERWETTDIKAKLELNDLPPGSRPSLLASVEAEGGVSMLHRAALLSFSPDGTPGVRTELPLHVVGDKLVARNAEGELLVARSSCVVERLTHDGKPTGYGIRHQLGGRCPWLGTVAYAGDRIYLASSGTLMVLNPALEIVARVAIPDRPRELVVLGAGPELPADTLDHAGPDGSLPAPASLPVAPRHHSIQLASNASRDKAEDALAKLDRALVATRPQLRGHVIEREGMWVVMLGDFADAEDAEAELPAAKQLLGQGGIVRDMASFCPITKPIDHGVSACIEGGFRGLRTSALEEIGDPRIPDTIEPFSFPPLRTAPRDPPQIVHPPATEILVITASKRPDFTHGPEDQHAVKFETLIWRPRDPRAPEAITEEAIERHPGIVYSDGEQLWELRVRRSKVAIAQCRCNYDEGPEETGRNIHPRMQMVEKRRFGSDEEWLDISPAHGEENCAETEDEWGADSMLVSIAGSRVFMIGTILINECGAHGNHDHAATGIDPEPVLAELPPATLDAMLAQLAKDFYMEDTPAEIEELWPHHLDIDAVFPDFGGRAPRLDVIALVDVAWPSSGFWRGYTDWMPAKVALPEWSELYPPPAAVELAGHKRRQVVIGWSQMLAPAGEPVEPAPDPSETPVADEGRALPAD